MKSNSAKCEMHKGNNETDTLDSGYCYGYDSPEGAKWILVTIFNLVFIAFYTIEFLVKIIGLGGKQYFTDPWNDFDFFVFILGIFDLLVILTIFLGVESGGEGGEYPNRTA